MTFMEGDCVPISYVPLCFTIIYEVVKKLSLPFDFVVHVRTSIRKRFKIVRSEVHVIELVLDPSVSRDRLSDVMFLYEKEDEFKNQSRMAFKKVCKWMRMSYENIGVAMSRLQMALDGIGMMIVRNDAQS